MVGITDMLAKMAPQASDMLSANFMHLMDELGNAQNFNVNLDDEIIGQMTVTIGGKVYFNSEQQKALKAKFLQKAQGGAQ